jgi:hypothetical protein
MEFVPDWTRAVAGEGRLTNSEYWESGEIINTLDVWTSLDNWSLL